MLGGKVSGGKISGVKCHTSSLMYTVQFYSYRKRIIYQSYPRSYHFVSPALLLVNLDIC